MSAGKDAQNGVLIWSFEGEGNRKRFWDENSTRRADLSTEIIERLATGDATVEDLHAASSAPQSSLSMPPKSLAVTCQHPSSGRQEEVMG